MPYTRCKNDAHRLTLSMTVNQARRVDFITLAAVRAPDLRRGREPAAFIAVGKIPNQLRISAAPKRTTSEEPLYGLRFRVRTPFRAVGTFGIVVAVMNGMMTATDTYGRDETGPISFMRWVFRRGNRVLTCETMISGAHAFDVCVLPSWERSEPVIERYNRFSEAVQRQAEMARVFRESGWAFVLNDDHPIAAA